jgi:hypothetical protein
MPPLLPSLLLLLPPVLTVMTLQYSATAMDPDSQSWKLWLLLMLLLQL